MKILLTNDDGIYAKGLLALCEQFSKKHEITIVAPDRSRSAVSHGITLYEPLRTSEVVLNGGYEGYAITGKPADCVKLGVQEILGCKPDMVISGINSGPNVGVSVNYSGTVAGAKEAALYGIPAMAVSINGYEDPYYEDAAFFTEKLAHHVFEKKLPFGTFLNVNVPDMPLNKIAGIRITRQHVVPLVEYFEKRTDPRNRPYHWLGGDTQKFETDSDTDGAVLEQNSISITPLKCDMTDYSVLDEIKIWDIQSLR